MTKKSNKYFRRDAKILRVIGENDPNDLDDSLNDLVEIDWMYYFPANLHPFSIIPIHLNDHIVESIYEYASERI